jgi:Domain of unknown function (DUF4281)
MQPEFLFQLYNTAILPAWIALMIWPGKSWVESFIKGVMLFLALSYVVCLIISFSNAPQPPDFSSLEGLIQALSGPWGMLTGWIHYLCFDLWVGLQLNKEAHQKGYPPFLRIPVLFFVLMTGPLGWLIFQIIKAVRPGTPTAN